MLSDTRAVAGISVMEKSHHGTDFSTAEKSAVS